MSTCRRVPKSSRSPVGLLALLASLAAAGCIFPGQHAQPTGQIRVTPRGASSTLKGNLEELAQGTQEIFGYLDITYLGRSSSGSTLEIRGTSGTSRVFVELEGRSPRTTDVRIRVRRPGHEWDRDSARGILVELRRWQAS